LQIIDLYIIKKLITFLKIRMSAVRFCPQPPVLRKHTAMWGVILTGWNTDELIDILPGINAEDSY
jgi:hypothetical protein